MIYDKTPLKKPQIGLNLVNRESIGINSTDQSKKENDVTIEDKKNKKIFGITLMKQTSIDSIYKLSGPLAKHNEFQVHYSALTGEYKSNGQTLFINIPLVYFNYKQIVNPSHVSFHMNNVKEVSDAIEPIAVTKAEELLSSSLIEGIKDAFPGIEFKVTSVHTMHRHPGQMSVFSGTDYKKNPDNPGIVYPILETEDTCSFSSIICPYKNTMKIVRTECRAVSMKEKKVIYRHGQSICHVSGYTIPQTELESFFGLDTETVASYNFIDGEIKTTETLNSLFTLFDLFDFEPSTDFISEKNVHTTDPDAPVGQTVFNKYGYGTNYSKKYEKQNKKQQNFSNYFYGKPSTNEHSKYTGGRIGLLDHMKEGLRKDAEEDEIALIRDMEDEVDNMALQDDYDLNTIDPDEASVDSEEEFEDLIEADSKPYALMFPVETRSGYVMFNQELSTFNSDGLSKRLKKELLYCDEVPSDIFALTDEEVFVKSFQLGIIIEKVEKENIC